MDGCEVAVRLQPRAGANEELRNALAVSSKG
jgi:hypothetical protein